MEFRTEYKTELNRIRLRLEVDGFYAEDYQIRMIRENEIRGLIPVKAHGEGECTVYEYDVTGLMSLEKYYKQRKITQEEMCSFLKQIQEAVDMTESYLLDPNRLLLEAEYIFYEEGTYHFCYFPQGEGEIRSSFHKLMEAFVQWTDYQDISSIKTAFFLHKETMKENYSLKRIVKKLETVKEEQQEKNAPPGEARAQKRSDGKSRPAAGTWQEEMEPQKRERLEFETDRIQHEWIASQEMGGRILKETDNLWNPVKRLLERRKRPKWGEWDGIYIDEEDL